MLYISFVVNEVNCRCRAKLLVRSANHFGIEWGMGSVMLLPRLLRAFGRRLLEGRL
jgi:hypothetical protein